MQTTPMSSASMSAAVVSSASEAQLKAEEIAAEQAKQQAAKIQQLRELIGKSHFFDLDLQEQKINAQDVTAVIAPVLISPECKFTSVIIGNNDLGDAGAASFAAILKHANNKLTSANLAWNGIGDQGAIALADALQDSNCRLAELNLTKNNFGAIGIRAIINALQNPSCKLTAIYLGTNNIGADDLRALANVVISRRNTSKPLNVYGIEDLIAKAEEEDRVQEAKLKAEQAAVIEHASAPPQPVSAQSANAMSLSASTSTATDDEAKRKAEEAEKELKAEQKAAAKAKQRLLEIKQIVEQAIKEEATTLDLPLANIGNEETKVIAAAIQNSNCKLTEIYLTWNNIGAADAAAIATALQSPNNKLTAIGLRWNNIGSAGAAAIAAALQNPNSKLTAIDLRGNNIGPEGVAAIATALQSPNCKLASINLGSNKIGPDGARAIAVAVVFRRRTGNPIVVQEVDNLDTLVAEIEKENREREEKLEAEQAAAAHVPAKSEEKAQAQSANAMSVSASTSTAADDEAKRKAEEKETQEREARELQEQQKIKRLVEEEKTNPEKMATDKKALLAKVAENDPDALYEIGWHCEHGTCGFVKDEGKACEYYIAAAVQGSMDAQRKLNDPKSKALIEAYDKERTIPVFRGDLDPSCNLLALEEKASSGDVDAQTRLGIELFYGLRAGKTDKNKLRGARWLLIAATQSNTVAGQCALGMCHLEGIETKQAPEAALRYFQTAAKSNYVPAYFCHYRYCFIQAISHFEQCDHTSIDKFFHLSTPYIEMAANHEDTVALYTLGNFNETGSGPLHIAKNPQQAVQYYEGAARRGDPRAQRKLGDCYQNSLLGLEKSESKAAQYYKEADQYDAMRKQYEEIVAKKERLEQERMATPQQAEQTLKKVQQLLDQAIKDEATTLYITDFGIDDAVARVIAAAIENPVCKLESIYLWGDNIKPDGVKAIAKAVVSRKTALNSITVHGIDTLDAAIAEIEKENKEREEKEQKTKQEAVAKVQHTPTEPPLIVAQPEVDYDSEEDDSFLDSLPRDWLRSDTPTLPPIVAQSSTATMPSILNNEQTLSMGATSVTIVPPTRLFSPSPVIPDFTSANVITNANAGAAVADEAKQKAEEAEQKLKAEQEAAVEAKQRLQEIQQLVAKAIIEGATNLDLDFRNIGNEEAKIVATAIQNPDCKFTSIHLANDDIGPEGVAVIATALSNPNCRLTSINFASSKIMEEGARTIAIALQNPNCKLTAIGFFSSDIGSKGAITIATSLQHPNCKLTLIDLQFNNIGLEGVTAIASALQHPNCKLTWINLGFNNIGNEEARIIATALQSPNCKLSSISLMNNSIGNEGARAIATAVAVRRRAGRPIEVQGVDNLDVLVAEMEKEEKDREEKLKAKEAEQKLKAEQEAAAKAKQRQQEIRQLIEQAIQENATSLDLSWKGIGNEEAKVVATAMQNPNCRLNSINLLGHCIGPEGARAIATAVVFCKKASHPIEVHGIDNLDDFVNEVEKENKAFQEIVEQAIKESATALDLSCRDVGDEEAKIVAATLQNPNCKLTSIYLWNNKIGAIGAIAIATALQNPNCKLTSIDLYGNNIGPEGVMAITTALQSPNCKLTSIGLNNNLGSDAVVTIATALQSPNCKLTIISFGYRSYIGPEGARALAQAVVFRRKAGRLIEVLGVDNLDALVAEMEKEEKDREEKLKAEEAEQKLKAEQEAAAKAKQRQQEIRQLFEKANQENTTKLYLGWAHIGDQEATIVADALQNPKCNLISIDLRDNNIGPEGAAAIATALQNQNCKLISINLWYNDIGPEGARAIAAAVLSRRRARNPIKVEGIDNLDALIVEVEEQERKEQEQKIKEATALAQENLLKAERSIVAERDLKQALQILLVDLQPQTAAQTLQQLADLVAITTPPIRQSLDEAQLKEVTAAFDKTLVGIRNTFPYEAALLEAQFRLGMSKQLYDDQNATEASLKQAVGFANQALQTLQAINLGAERKDSKIARRNCKLGEAYRLLGDINYRMSSYGQAYEQQAINAYQAALKILPDDKIAAEQLASLPIRSAFVEQDTRKTGKSGVAQMDQLTEHLEI